MKAPPAEVRIDADLIAALVAAQHPDLAGPVRIAAEGWDNVVARLGDHHAVRLPRRALAVPLLENEMRWLPTLRLPIATPIPVRRGTPGAGYPWPWAITPWYAGRVAAEVTPSARRGLAEGLARFHRALHVPAPADAPINPYRGIPLAGRDPLTRRHLAADPDLAPLWDEALAAPPYAGPARWLHGDPHPGNLLIGDDGCLGAVLDFGDLCAGDPACDIATAWLTLDGVGRSRYRASLQPDGHTWERARGWAVAMTAALLATSDDTPVMAQVGRWAHRQLLLDR